MSRFLCPVCETPLYVEPPAKGKEDDIQRPTNLKGFPCCISACGHLVHSKCLIRSLAQNPDAGCPVCKENVVAEECGPFPLPISETPVVSRARSTSSAFGQVNAVNSGVKIPRTTSSSPSGQTVPAATSSPSAISASGSPPMPKIYECQVLGLKIKITLDFDITTILTPELLRRCNEHLQQILPGEQARQEFCMNNESLSQKSDIMDEKSEDAQFKERFLVAAFNRFLEVDSNVAHENVGTLTEALSKAATEFNRWWDSQNFSPSSTGSLPVHPLPPIPTFREVVLEMALKGSPNLSTVLTPELCRRCDEQLQRILPSGQALQEMWTNMHGALDRLDRVNEQQVRERVAVAVANRFLEVDADEARENVATLTTILSEMMAEFNRWWDSQNF